MDPLEGDPYRWSGAYRASSVWPTDYSPLEKKYGLVILEGSEVETEYGHVLVYGVTEGLMKEFDFARTDNLLQT